MPLALGIALLAHELNAHGLRAQTLPPRPLGAIVTASADSFARSSVIRVLSDGHVLVNDPAARRIVLLDASLAHPRVVADTTGATSKAYGAGLIGLMPFPGDSSLTIDRTTGAAVVIAPTGVIARIIQRPRPVGFSMFSASPDPYQFDQAGHFLTRAPSPFYLGLLPQDFVGDTLMVGPDSVAVIREDIATRRMDTLVMLKAVRNRQAVSRPAPGRGSGRSAFNPMPSGDDWTVLNDGTVAVVRVADYHIDWIGPDKRVVAGPKVPAQWTPVSPERKAAIIDSTRANLTYGGVLQQAVVQPSDLPDFIPPFTTGFARADAAGNVWVRENHIGSVYDVIARDGKLTDRVTLPAGSVVAGFGTAAVYFTRGNGLRVQLAKAALR